MLKKALIVDDLPFDAELTCRVLRSCDFAHEVVVVSDGEQALRELHKAQDYDVVLLDLALPKVDGFEVLKEISPVGYSRHCPVELAQRVGPHAHAGAGGERVRRESNRLRRVQG